MSKRAQRRYHYRRLKDRVKWYYGGSWNGNDQTYSPQPDDVRGCIVESRPSCSCDMCGNPRRKGWVVPKLTIQERKELQDSIHDLMTDYYRDKE